MKKRTEKMNTCSISMNYFGWESSLEIEEQGGSKKSKKWRKETNENKS